MYSFDEQTRWLETRSTLFLRRWIEQAIRFGRVAPVQTVSKDDDVRDLIIRHFRNSQDLGFRHRVCRIIFRLFIRWQHFDGIGYLVELLELIAAVNVEEAYKVLLKQAASSHFSRMTLDDQDIHGTILQVLVGFRTINPQLTAVLARDIHIPRYAAISYSGLWLADSKYAVEYLPVITAHALEWPLLVDYPFVIHNAMSTLGPDAFYSQLPQLVARLSSRLLTKFLSEATRWAPLDSVTDDNTCTVYPANEPTRPLLSVSNEGARIRVLLPHIVRLHPNLYAELQERLSA